jgi:hypothetical protein
MTKQQFDKLKVGDSVYLKNTYNEFWTGTEVLKIDRIFSKVEVLLGRRPYSYRYISVNKRPASCFVGVCSL